MKPIKFDVRNPHTGDIWWTLGLIPHWAWNGRDVSKGPIQARMQLETLAVELARFTYDHGGWDGQQGCRVTIVMDDNSIQMFNCTADFTEPMIGAEKVS